MKKKLILAAVLSVILLTGCVVKSLKPFYTKETLAYDASILGVWKDSNDGIWEVRSMQAEMEKDNPFRIKEKQVASHQLENTIKNTVKGVDGVKIDAKVTVSKDKSFFEDKELEAIYKKSYWVAYKSENKPEAFFIVVPFQIKNQMFLDFRPFDWKTEVLSDFATMHYIGVHTLAKLDKNEGNLEISWFAEDKIEDLFAQQKIRIAHEKVGVDNESYLLTASSEELQKFIAKYMDADDKNKWETSVKFTLKRTDN